MKSIHWCMLALLTALYFPALFAETHPNVERGISTDKMYSFSDVDNVNIFNGNVSIRIPIGGSFPVSEHLSYSLTLTYNSKLWDSESIPLGPPNFDHDTRRIPALSSNAGLGWLLTLGRLIAPGDVELNVVPAATNHDGGAWRYLSSDGSDHTFADYLHSAADSLPSDPSSGMPIPESGIQYTNDGSYLRLNTKSAEPFIEFPDGTIQSFEADPAIHDAFRLKRISDRFGNFVDVHYTDLEWTITDKHGRSTIVTFEPSPIDSHAIVPVRINYAKRVASIKVPAFAGQDATYRFTYTIEQIHRGRCGIQIDRPQDDNTIKLPMLAGVELPGSAGSFEFRYYKGDPGDPGTGDTGEWMPEPGTNVGDPTCHSGEMRLMRTPTFGWTSYEYGDYAMPAFGCETASTEDLSSGIRARKLWDIEPAVPWSAPNGTPVQTWIYTPKLNARPYSELFPCTSSGPVDRGYSAVPADERTVTITAPADEQGPPNETVHYFSVWPTTKNWPPFYSLYPYIHKSNMGLPFSAAEPEPGNSDPHPRFLSTTSCKGPCSADAHPRKTYVRYEMDNNSANSWDNNRRLVSSSTHYEDGTVATTDYSDFDGLGHYRTTTESGNFGDGALARITSVQYNRPDATVNFDAFDSGTFTNTFRGTGFAGTFSMWPSSRPWLLNTFTSSSTIQGDQRNRTDSCFDPATAFLRGSRKRRSVSSTGDAESRDFASAFTHSGDGNVSSEVHYGGDSPDDGTVSFADSEDLCSTLITPGDTAPGPVSYQVNHTYMFGVRATSEPVRSAHAPTFKSLDRTIDHDSGLTLSSRDTTGATTTFHYDALGRADLVTPPAPLPATYYYYRTAGQDGTSFLPAQIEIATAPSLNDTGAIRKKVQFDRFARPWRELQLTENDQWSIKVTHYSPSGLKDWISEPQNITAEPPVDFDPPHKTRFENFDAFGRARTIVAPDNTSTTICYGLLPDCVGGIRDVARTVALGTSEIDGAVALSNITTKETYDRFGHLVAVAEHSGTRNGSADSDLVTTRYRYDLADRLLHVTTQDTTISPAAIQERDFVYDGAGLLTQETHPENGTTFYLKYDAGSHLLRKQEGEAGGKFDIRFTYDDAGRSLGIFTAADSTPIKEFIYDRLEMAKGAPWDFTSVGRLLGTIRHNTSQWYGDYPVGDYLRYNAAGQLIEKATSIPLAGTVKQTYTYDELGMRSAQTYPSCSGCASADPVRQVQSVHRNGFLTAVPGYASGIKYWPGGMPAEITHLNAGGTPGPVDTQLIDDSGLNRPKSIVFRGYTDCSPITAPPADAAVTSGGTATFVVRAIGTAQYQWYRGQSHDTSQPIAGATQDSYTTDVMTETQSFWVRVSDGNNSSCVADSSTVQARVCAAPEFLNSLASYSRSVSGPMTISLSIDVRSAGTTSYQWQQSPDGMESSFTNIDGETSSSLNTLLNATAGAYYYRVKVTACGNVRYSDVAVFTYVASCVPLQFTLQPSGYTPDSVGDYVYLSARATGDGTLYRWYHGFSNPQPVSAWSANPQLSDWQMSANYDVFFVRALNTCGVTADSQRVYVRVYGTCDFPPVAVDSTSVDIVGGSTAVLSASDDWGFVTYQWYSGMSGDTREPLTGVSGHPNQLRVGSFAKTYWVRAVGECSYHDSPTVSVNVLSQDAQHAFLCGPVLITGQSSAQSVASGQTVTLSVDAHATPEITHYQWYRGTDIYTAVPLGTGRELTVTPNATASYFVRVSSDCAFADTVPVMTHVTSCTGLTIATQPLDANVSTGVSASLNVAVTAPPGVPVSYQWYGGESGDTSHPVAGTNSPAFSTGPLSVAASYWVRATTAVCTVDSRTAHVSIKPTIFRQPVGFDVRWMQRVYLTVGVSGTGPLTYQWYRVDGSTATPVGSLDQLPVAAVAQQRFWVRVTGPGGFVDSSIVTVTGCNVAVISTQPQSPTIHSGETATLTVAAQQPAQSPVIHYAWYRGLVGEKSAPVGTDSATFTTPILTATTNYWVDVISGACETLSGQATVSMCALPAVTISAPASVHKGDSVTLTVAPNLGTSGITYAFYQGPSGNTSTPVTSYASNSVVVQAQSTASYWCRVSNATCSVDTTAATVSVCVPTITIPPAGGTIVTGQSLLLSVAADVAITGYQWYRGNTGDTTNPISGATSPTYTAAPTATTSYWVRVTGTCGVSTNSAAAVVTVCTAPAVTTHPTPQSVTRGQSVTLSVTAAGSNLTYQWYQGAGTATPYGGATTSSLTMTPQATATYWCRVTNSCGTADSNAAQVDVCATPSITTQPQSVTVAGGSTATLSVVAQQPSQSPALHYQWYRGSAGDRTAPVGSNASSYTTPPLTAAASYWIAVSSGACETASQQVTVSMCALPAVAATGPTGIRKGQVITLSLSPNPGTNGISYQWYQGAAGDTSSPLTSAVFSSVNVQPQVTTTYWCKVSDATCSVNSAATTATVCIPQITVDPASHQITAGQSWTLTTATDVPASTFQWYRGNPGDTTNPIAGATAASLSVSPAVTTTYFARATGSCGQSTDSAAATVSVCVLPAITSNPGGASITRGQSVTLSVTATGTNLTYQWYQGAGTGSPYGGATSTSLTTTPQVPTSYWCRVTGSCGTADSAAAQVNVCTTPSISVQPRSQTISSGGAAVLSVTAAEATGLAMHYQWYRSTSGVPANPVGTDSPTYTTAALNADTSYFVRITSGACYADSNTAAMSMCDLPLMSLTGGGSVAVNQTITLRVTPAPDGATYAFYEGVPGDTTNFAGGGGIQSALSIMATHDAQYWCRIDNGTCQVDTNSVTVTVH